MKITLLGSLGHIGKPLARMLVTHGHQVTVVSSQATKQTDIEAIGARAAIGSVDDVDFLTAQFTGADIVYSMVPPPNYFVPGFDLTAYCARIGNGFARAINGSGVKRVIHLSSIGAHLEKNSGLILAHRQIELILGALTGVDVTFMRPTSFHYNLFPYIAMIKSAGLIAANYGADDPIVWVAPADIAAAVVAEMESAPVHRKVCYVASEILTGTQTAGIIGEAIGLPGLKWVIVPDDQVQSGLTAVGMDVKIAAGLVEMYSAVHDGSLFSDYYLHPPARLGTVKMTDFAKEFAEAYKTN